MVRNANYDVDVDNFIQGGDTMVKRVEAFEAYDGKGKKLTASQIEVIRKNSTGRKHSDETKAKISAGNKGKVISQASRLKMSRRRLEYFQNRDNSSGS